MYEKITYYSRMSQTLHVPVPAGGLDSATTAWISAVQAQGGTVSITQQGYVDTLIKGLKADGLFTLGDGLWLFAGENDAAQATVSILAGNIVGVKGSNVTQAAGGYSAAVADTDTYFDSTLVPGGSLNYQLNAASLGSYIRTQTYDATSAWGSNVTSNSYSVIFQLETTFRYYLNSATVNNPVIGTTDKIGLWTVSRTDGSTTTAYRNGGSVGTNAGDTSTALPTSSISFMARHEAGGFTANDGDTHGAAWMGGALDATQASNLYTRIQAYMTSWGFQV